jgi:hypothetical protein
MVNARDPVEAEPALAAPPNGEYVFLLYPARPPPSASVYVVMPGPLTTFDEVMAEMYVEIPAPPDNVADFGRASR